jgi:two-component system cell cycle response regulator
MSMDETVVRSIHDVDQNTATEPYLIIVAGQNIGKLYNIDKAEFIAGRSQECGIWIEDATISRKHFRIINQGSQCTIEDLNSTNGTFVNNHKIQKAILKAGDKIQISKETIIQFDYFDEHRKVSEQKRYEMGVKDPVTGTYNKSYFLQRISEEFSFSQRQNLPLSILIFDIDFFKIINDNFGHLAGDQVLQEIGVLVQAMIRQDDVFCRYGGEEFVIIMRNTECQAAVNLAERIRIKVQDHVVYFDDKPIKATISIGVATLLDKNFRDYVGLVAEADKHLYNSKGSGRNRVSAICVPKLN